jgi:hypothetical protein
MLFGARVPDEVALTVLSHLDDPRDLLRVAETCRRALRLARGSPPPQTLEPTGLTGVRLVGGGGVRVDRQLWEVVLRRSPHERAVRWCSLVLGGIPPHLARGAASAAPATVTAAGEAATDHNRGSVLCNVSCGFG